MVEIDTLFQTKKAKKTIPFGAAHTYTAYIRDYPPPRRKTRCRLSVLYATRNDPRPQMIPKIDLNTTRDDPRPQMIPKFFHTRPKMIPEELSEWNGMTVNSRRC